jgi:hypothetical protein
MEANAAVVGIFASQDMEIECREASNGKEQHIAKGSLMWQVHGPAHKNQEWINMP